MEHSSSTRRSALRRRRGAGAVLVMLLAGSTGAAAVLVARWPSSTAAPETVLDVLTRPRPLDAALGEIAAGAALLVLLATALSTLVSVALAARARARPGSRRPAALEAAVAPAILRRLAATAVGVGVLTGTAATAASAAAPEAPAASAPLVPSWPAAGERAAPPGDAGAQAPPTVEERRAPPVEERAGEGRTADDDVVVVRGDTLWGIAAAHLPEDAAPAVVAEQWPRWWSANRSTVGDDPDLILPGQRLRAPAGSAP